MARQDVKRTQTRQADNAGTGEGGKRDERKGPVEFSDRYRGPQERISVEADRAKPGNRYGSRTAKAPVTTSEGNKERLTSPALATQRATLPSATTQQRSERPTLPSEATAARDRQVSVTGRPALQETRARDVPEQKAIIPGKAERVAREVASTPPVSAAREKEVGLKRGTDGFFKAVGQPVFDPPEVRRRGSR